MWVENIAQVLCFTFTKKNSTATKIDHTLNSDLEKICRIFFYPIQALQTKSLSIFKHTGGKYQLLAILTLSTDQATEVIKHFVLNSIELGISTAQKSKMLKSKDISCVKTLRCCIDILLMNLKCQQLLTC